MVIIGLVGLVASGKSYVADALKSHRFSIFNADHEVHDLLDIGGGAVEKVKKLFPETYHLDGYIDRKDLGQIVFNDSVKLQQLENIIHPLVRDRLYEFLHHSFLLKKEIVILDIPLLFKSKISNICDLIIMIKCTKIQGLNRFMARPYATEDKFNFIVEEQKKYIKNNCSYYDILINTARGKFDSNYQIRTLKKKIKFLLENHARNFSGYRNYRFKSIRWT